MSQSRHLGMWAATDGAAQRSWWPGHHHPQICPGRNVESRPIGGCGISEVVVVSVGVVILLVGGLVLPVMCWQHRRG